MLRPRTANGFVLSGGGEFTYSARHLNPTFLYYGGFFNLNEDTRAIRENSWKIRGKSVKIRENSWKSVEIRGNPWKIRGNPLKSVEIRGNPWKSVEIRGNQIR